MKIHVIITMLALFAILIAAVWYARKKYKINFAVLGLGAVAFFASSQVLEKIVHLLVLHPQKDGTVPLMSENPLLYVIYGISMAAIFEETARLIFFKWLEKKRTLEDSDALAYGLGHGGLELIYIGIASLLNLFILFSAVESQNPNIMQLLPESTLATINNLAAWQIYLLGLERILALLLQVGLTFWVYQAVRQKKWIYLVAAYGLHALFDLAPSLSQVGWLSNPLLVEVILLVELLAFVWLTKSTFWKKSS
ncbi:YhfC family intramembrane metalloprotease [Streptococcus pseudopneumoniae]|uniref:YhfC family intramembrane metalloprotease n=1 Tax=Streptococcus pseudopneumoniae TaxID=257758 RepID=UPI00066DC5FC|nr:YhfC family glutamic-type intramembrane protease [Streptococcus pseudopneumoniae]